MEQNGILARLQTVEKSVDEIWISIREIGKTGTELSRTNRIAIERLENMIIENHHINERRHEQYKNKIENGERRMDNMEKNVLMNNAIMDKTIRSALDDYEMKQSAKRWRELSFLIGIFGLLIGLARWLFP